jgi:hypothetical protein
VLSKTNASQESRIPVFTEAIVSKRAYPLDAGVREVIEP